MVTISVCVFAAFAKTLTTTNLRKEKTNFAYRLELINEETQGKSLNEETRDHRGMFFLLAPG